MNTLAKRSGGIALVTALAAMAAPALAGGLAQPVMEPVVEAAPAPVVVAPNGDWTGFHASLQLGYGSAKNGGPSDQGGLYGVRAGYDHDFGNWVLGGALDWNKADIDLNATDSLDSVARLGLRAGVDMGRSLVYATGGLARAEVDQAGTNVSDNGWFGGVGMDYQINDRWTVGGEILTHRFEDFGGGTTTLSATTALLNVGMRF